MSNLEQRQMPSNFQEDEATVLENMRRAALRRVLYVVVGIGFFLFVGGSYAVWIQGRVNLIPVYAVVYATIVAITFLPRIPYEIRAAIVSGTVYFVGLFDLMTTSWEEDMRAFFVAFPAMTALFFGRGWGFASLLLVVLTLLFPGQLLQSYLDPTLWPPELRAIRTGGFVVVTMMGGVLINAEDVLVEYLRRALEATAERAKRLRQMQEELDQQVSSMRKLNYTAQRRVMHLEAGAQVAQELGGIFDPDQLVERAATLISRSFGFYHAGIFLVDEAEEWAILRAASSEGGRKMLEHGHRLRRGEGMVGWVLIHHEPRVALDVGQDAVHFANPFLPATRSELALPLMVGQRLIGVLDVQSTEEAAFDQDDVRALSFLAAQLAVALDNAMRLRGEAEQLEATSSFYRMVRRLSSATTERDAYEAIMMTLADYTPTQAVLYMLDREEDRLSAVAQFHNGKIYFRSEEGVQEGMAELFDAVFRRQQLLFAESTEDLDDPILRREWERMELGENGALALVPIEIDAGHRAMLYILYQHQHHFAPVERRLYASMADMAGTALARAFLMLEVDATARRERWLQAFTEELMSLFEIPLVAENAGTILLQRMGAKGVRVDIQPHSLTEQEEVA